MSAKKSKEPFSVDRVVEHAMVPAGQLLAHPDNFRVHNSIQQQLVGQSLEDIGWVRRVLVNRKSGRVVDGHLRVVLAMRQGEETPVPVDYVDLTDQEEAYLLAMLDESTMLAYVDPLKYKTLVDGILAETPQSSVLVVLNDALASRRKNLYGSPISLEERVDLLESHSSAKQEDISQDDGEELYETFVVLDTDQQDEFDDLLKQCMVRMSMSNASLTIMKILHWWNNGNKKKTSNKK